MENSNNDFNFDMYKKRYHVINKTNRRDEIKLLCDILNMCRQRIIKTHLMYSANLGYYQMNKYLELGFRLGLIESDGKYYSLTEKGLEFLRLLS